MKWFRGFNLLSLLVFITLVVAMLLPWWSIDMEFAGQTDLYPYKLDGPLSEFVGYTRSPQMSLLTTILAVAIALCFFSSFIKGWIGGIGLFLSSALLALGIWRFMMRIEDVADRFGLSIEGYGRGHYGGFAEVYVATWLRPGIYLISIGAGLALLACLLHKFIWVRVE